MCTGWAAGESVSAGGLAFPSKRIRDASARLFGPPCDVCVLIGAVVHSELLIKAGAPEMAAGRGEQLQVIIDYLRVEAHRNIRLSHPPSCWLVGLVAHTSSLSHPPGSKVRMS